MSKRVKNKAARAALYVVYVVVAAVLISRLISFSPPKTDDSSGGEAMEVYITIECTAVYKNDNYSKLPEALKADGALPESGYFAQDEKVVCAEGDTVYDLLTDYCASAGIALDCDSPAQNLYGTAYVRGIGGLYEFDCTKNSGWVYTVDGDSPDVGMSDFTVSDGQRVTVSYTVY